MTFKTFRSDIFKLFETQHKPHNGLEISKQYSNGLTRICIFLTEKPQKYI